MRTDARIDAYIATSAPFAQPLLTQLRSGVHAACPEANETMKWRMPFFEYHGALLGHMAAFRQHCAFGFWRGGPGSEAAKTGEAMGQFRRIEGKADLPGAREFKALVKAQMARIDGGAAPQRLPAARTSVRAALETPPDFVAALAKQPAARQAFEAFAPSHRRDYVEWVIGAKREATRGQRIAQAVAWIAEGRPGTGSTGAEAAQGGAAAPGRVRGSSARSSGVLRCHLRRTTGAPSGRGITPDEDVGRAVRRRA